MSVVTNVIVSPDILEGDALDSLVRPIVNDPRSQSLKPITGDKNASAESYRAAEAWGGTKYPECSLYAAAFNYLDWDAFALHIESIGWEHPNGLQVFVFGQEDTKWTVWMLRNRKLTRCELVFAEDQ